MSEVKTWFRPDKKYLEGKTPWFINCFPQAAGWYDTTLIKPRPEWNWFYNHGLTTALVSYEENPFIERRWFDSGSLTWSRPCIVGDPDEYAYKVKLLRQTIHGSKRQITLQNVYLSNVGWMYRDLLVAWRGLREKPVYPPDYYN